MRAERSCDLSVLDVLVRYTVTFISLSNVVLCNVIKGLVLIKEAWDWLESTNKALFVCLKCLLSAVDFYD